MADDSLHALVERYGLQDLLSREVLIVDDDEPNLAVLSGFLEMEDYVAHEASSGREALEIARSQPIDIVVTDQRMPYMTGVQLLQELRSLKPDVAGIVLTGYTDSPAIIAAINEARAFRFLTKPWQAEELLGTIDQASSYVYQRRAIRRLVDLLAHRNEELGVAVQELRATQARLLHLERLSTMGRLTAGIAHDLRDFLNGLVFLEQELHARDGNEEIKLSVEVGLAGIRNLLATMDGLRDFARGGRLQIAADAIEPGKVVHDAITVAQMDLDFRRRNVVVEIDGGLQPTRGDGGKLTQALVNLLRNAIQATGQGQTVRVQARQVGAELLLAVEDEGPGIPEPLRSAVFEPFVSSKGEKGLGMGLYMARLVAESHGGALRFAPAPSGGARFELAVPLVEERHVGKAEDRALAHVEARP